MGVVLAFLIFHQVAQASVPERAAATQASAGRRARPERPAVWVRYEWRRDRFAYRFENPSRFDTAFNVPHFFAQTYSTDNHWLVAGGRYKLFDGAAETEVGITPERETVGDDYDTFFDPNGNVIVYGTTAEVSLRSLQVSQRIEQPVGAWTARFGYTYQRDRSIYHPSLTTTTQSNPPSFASFLNAARETTISAVHEIRLGVGRQLALSRTWTIAGSADVAPVRLAMLTTILPDKYPGQDIVFISKGVSLYVRTGLAWGRGPWRIDATVAHYGTRNYRSSNQFRRTTTSAAAQMRFSPGR
jgi:hypothetical protein